MVRIIPKKFQKHYNKRGTSRKSAIRSFCLECMGNDPEESIASVKGCTDVECPLYSWRKAG